jgi:hypothetical protein
MKKTISLIALGFALSMGAAHAQAPNPAVIAAQANLDKARAAHLKESSEATAAKAAFDKAFAELKIAEAALAKKTIEVAATKAELDKAVPEMETARNAYLYAEQLLAAAQRDAASASIRATGSQDSGQQAKTQACNAWVAKVQPTPPSGMARTFFEGCMASAGSSARAAACGAVTNLAARRLPQPMKPAELQSAIQACTLLP